METAPPFLLMRTRLVEFLDRQPKVWLWIEAIMLSCVIGWLDYITGYEISFVLFYSLPILLMVWFADRTSAICIALLCSIIYWWGR